MAKEQPNKAKPAGKNSQEPKKPKFSPYWIYAGIILIFLGIQFFAGGGFNEPSKTNPAEFETTYLSSCSPIAHDLKIIPESAEILPVIGSPKPLADGKEWAESVYAFPFDAKNTVF